MQQMKQQQTEMKAQEEEMSAQQDREMALLTKEFKALGSKADSAAADAPADKKSSACALQ
jgi:hypothetical protein